MPAPIIAAYNPFSEDRAPVELALAAARFTGAPVLAAAVYPWSLGDGSSELDGETQRAVSAAMRRLFEDLDVETQIVSDISVPRALHQLAREIEAGLIVVGSTARGLAGRVLTGSTAERLLQGAPCPVALAPSGYARAELDTIAVGWVDSPEGHAALAAGHALARRADARLRVVAVLHPSGGIDAALADGLKPPRGVTLEGRHRAAVAAALDAAIAALPAGVDIEADIHVDDPADVLIRISEHVDLLVMGSRGYGPLRSLLLGGVSRRVVDNASCPVLVLPRGAGVPLEDLLSASGQAAAR